jgi:hypothetical protein
VLSGVGGGVEESVAGGLGDFGERGDEVSCCNAASDGDGED